MRYSRPATLSTTLSPGWAPRAARKDWSITMVPPPAQAPGPAPRPPLSLGRRLLFGVLPVLLLIGGGELLARQAPAEMLDTRSIRVRAAVQAGSLVASYEVPGWDIQPGDGDIDGAPYHVNAWNMRGPDYAEVKPAGAERIILLGDSTPFGVQLPWEETFLAQFAAHRAAAFPDRQLEVAACACPGHSTYQSIFKLKGQCLAFEPDYVILANQNSDSALDVAEDKDAFPAPVAPALRRFFSNFAMYRLISAWMMPPPPPPRTIAQVGEGPQGDILRVNNDDFIANQTQLVAMVRAAGAKPVFLILPARGDVISNPNFPADRHGRKQMLRDLAQSLDVPVVDGQSWFQAMYADQDLFIDTVHPNAKGAALLGKVLHAQFPR
jgi:hypothetical protein